MGGSIIKYLLQTAGQAVKEPRTINIIIPIISVITVALKLRLFLLMFFFASTPSKPNVFCIRESVSLFMPFLFPSFLIRTSPLPLYAVNGGTFAAFLAGSHADIETVIKEIKAEIRIDGQEITNFSSKYISFIIIWDRAFNSSRNRLITPTPPLCQAESCKDSNRYAKHG